MIIYEADEKASRGTRVLIFTFQNTHGKNLQKASGMAVLYIAILIYVWHQTSKQLSI
jgi:hypothetical protein